MKLNSRLHSAELKNERSSNVTLLILFRSMVMECILQSMTVEACGT
jgi:hypothetical protein